MARPLRIEMEHGIYHVTSRGWEKRVIVDGERDRADWLRLAGFGRNLSISRTVAIDGET